jgi:hypothetical protein
MSRHLVRASITLVLCLSVAIHAAEALADPAPAGPDRAAPAHADSVHALGRAVESEPSVPVARPLDPEMQAALDHELAELGRLQRAFEQATDAATKLEVQRSIDVLKQNTEIELLQIQVRRIRDLGQLDEATELENTIAVMLERLSRRSLQPSDADPR